MATGTYIFVNEEYLNRISEQLVELKNIIVSKNNTFNLNTPEDPMDSADVIRYLKITRRTLYKYRNLGLPTTRKANGKLFFWRSDIDEFLKNQFPNQK